MAKQINRLKPTELRALKAGRHHDGRGLYFQVSPTGSRSWIFRFKPKGRNSSRDMGLGPWPAIRLKQARHLAHNVYGARWAIGIDPIEERREESAEREADAALMTMTFKRAAETYMNEDKGATKKWKVWRDAFTLHVYPKWAAKPVAKIDGDMVRDLLNPLWNTKTVTAKMLRSRIEEVLGWATHRKYRQGDNPARWKGNLEFIFGRRKGRQPKNQPSLPYGRVRSFMASLGDGTASQAFRFMILTATRANEAVAAEWDEIDFKERTWTIPAERMKMKKEHRVPLSDAAIQILRDMKKLLLDDWVFTTDRKAHFHISISALRCIIERLNRNNEWMDPTVNKPITAHGFRATFRTWANEETGYPHEVKEAALAHAIKSDVEKAYVRGSLFEKRKSLMDDWGAYCIPAAKVSRKAKAK